MNRCRIQGILTKTDKTYNSDFLYELKAPRVSGFIDTVLVLSPDPDLPEGDVLLKGTIKSKWLPDLGMPVYVVPDEVAPGSGEVLSRAAVVGRIKEDPVCRTVGGKKEGQRERLVTSVLLLTEDGPIPVTFWEKNARKLSERHKAGDVITAAGRLQSRQYLGRDGKLHTTYELSAGKFCPGEKGAVIDEV